MVYRRAKLIWLLLCLAVLSGCVAPRIPPLKCRVLLEDNALLSVPQQIWEVKQGQSLQITVGVPTGQRIASVNYENHSVSPKVSSSPNFDYYTLTLHQIRYDTLLRIAVAPAYTTGYHAAGGEGASISLLEESPHLYFNTLPYRQQFTRKGHVPIGWNTAEDGSGLCVGFGSRIDHRTSSHLDLYMHWLPASPTSDFLWEEIQGEAIITGYLGSGEDLVIPMELDGYPVRKIASGAFGDLTLNRLVLSPSLKTIENAAFGHITAQKFYFFDDLAGLQEETFQSYSFREIHIQAVVDPVYSGSYFDTFADKMDYLDSLRHRPKIVLFCGSSARFGYDSEMLDAAFPNYRTVNMGVYAYSNMRPQGELILQRMGQGDILLSSPELDAIDKQFCSETDLDKETFCMVESNYDLFSQLDCRNYTHIFGAYAQYTQSRLHMTPRSYLESAADYDEDGNRLLNPSYNLQGDYIVYRPNNSEGKNFGVKRAFYNKSYIRPQDLAGLNALYTAFLKKGVSVYFTYSPRSATSISPDSTPDSIAQLDAYFRRELVVPVISPIHASLMDPYYFHGTDNHLCTEGVTIHTRNIITWLQEVMKEETP